MFVVHIPFISINKRTTMASTEDPRLKQLQNMPNKQMKSVLHARFLEKCREADVIPKGLTLKLQVSVGGNSEELQTTVNNLLHRVSFDICEKIRDDHIRKSRQYDSQIEIIRADIQRNTSAEKFTSIEEETRTKTEKAKELIERRHSKKLESWKNVQLKDVPVIVIDEAKESTSDEQWQQVPRRKRKTQKQNQDAQRQNQRQVSSNKNKSVSSAKNAQKNILSKNHKKNVANQGETPREQEHDISKNIPKNGNASGPKTYSKAVQNEAEIKTMQTLDVQKTLEFLTKAVTELLANKRNDVKDDSSGLPTKTHGRKRNGGSRKS